MSEHGRVEGKAALVTGASSGLGRATAIALAGAGADVALAARSKDELQGAKGEISKLGRRALTLPLDLASETETAEAVGRTFEAFGRIDILINAAGTDAPGTVEELSVEGWDRTLDVNLRAPEFTEEAVDLVAAEGFDPEFGARPLRRTIQRKVDNELSRMLLEGSLNSGDRVVVGVEDGKPSFEVLEESALVGTESGDEPGE